MSRETALTRSDINALLDSYRNNTPQRVLAATYSISLKRLKRILIANGFSGGWRDAYPLNESAFSGTTSPEMAYWAGFLMADGNVSDQGRIGLKLAAKDECHLQAFRDYIGSGHVIHRRTDIVRLPQGGGGVYDSVSLAFHSKGMAADLAKYGVVPNKTKTSCFSADVRMNRFAWLGLIDGDGSIRIEKQDPRLFLCGSVDILTQFNDFIVAKLGMKPRKIQCVQGRVPQLHVTGANAQKIVRSLWSDHDLGMKRKRDIAEAILTMTINKPGRRATDNFPNRSEQ